jgi:hypothetical protein
MVYNRRAIEYKLGGLRRKTELSATIARVISTDPIQRLKAQTIHCRGGSDHQLQPPSDSEKKIQIGTTFSVEPFLNDLPPSSSIFDAVCRNTGIIEQLYR